MKQTSTSKSCKYSTLLSFLLLLFLATFATPRAFAANGEREAYVNCDTREGYIVTFYYDEHKENRPGAIFSLNTGKNEPKWVEHLNNLSPLGHKARVAVFDSSFKEYRPTSCHNWFYGFSRMTDIDGLENLDTRNVTDMSGMFKGCISLQDIDLSSFNTEKVTDMSEMFSSCSNLTSIDLSSFNTENVTDMHGMFTGCANLMLLNLSSFNTAKVTNMNSMFGSCEWGDEFNYSCSGCQSLRAIFVSDSWDTDKVNKSSNMFTNCTALCGGKGTQYSSGNTNATYARADGGTQSPGYLTNGYAYACKSTDGTTLTFHYDDQFLQRTGTTYVLTSQNATPNWYSDESYRTVTKVVFDPAFSEARPTTCARWFADMANITTIDGLEHLNTSDVTDMSRMFCNCNGLTNLDLSTFNTAKVTDMQSMFSGCGNLKTIRVTDDWSIAKVVNSKNMFAGCSSLIGSRGTAYANAQVTDKSYAQVDGGASSPGYLTDDVPYAVLSDDGTTLTFYNDGKASDHDAEKVFLVDWKGTSDNYVKLANNNERLTASQAANITTVAFDGSFASLKPLSCRGWFYGFESLTTIDNFIALNTSKVRTMRDMFHGCKSIQRIYLSGINTHNVTDMHGMFYGCESLDYFDDLDLFTTHNVTDMSYMFYGCSNYNYLYLYCFNTTNVTDMSYMFCGCSKLNQSYSIIDPDFDYDFIGDYTDCLDLRNFSTGKVTNMAYMFSGCVNIENISLKGFNTASVTDMTGMFSGCSKLRTIITQNDWDTKKVTQSNNMFAGCTRILGSKGTTYNPTHTDKSYARLDGGKKGTPGYLSPVDNSYIVVSPDGTTFTFYCDRKKSSRTGTLYKLPNSSASWPKWIEDVSAKVLHSFEYNSTITKVVFDESFKNARPVWCQNWFHNFESLTSIEGLNNLNTSVVTSMYGMFSGCCSLTSLDLSSFDTSNVEEMSDMFKDCDDLETLDISNFNTENVSSMGGMFCNCYNLTSLNLSSFNTAKVTNMSYMFSCCDNLETLTIDANKFNTGNVTDMNNMFGNCHKLTSLDVSKFNTANVTDMNNMFSNCENLAYLDVSKFNTANVTNMNNMFSYCESLANLDVSKFNTANVTDMNNMFSKCGSLANLDVSKFNTANVTNMNNMFSYCESLTYLDVSKFNTGKVTNMNGMFSGCGNLANLDVSKFNTANVTYMSFMFSLCESLKYLDVSKFNTANVTDMYFMFSDCESLENLDVCKFNTNNVGSMEGMFKNCSKVQFLDVRGFNTANVNNMSEMFSGCGSLTSLDVRGFNTANVGNMGQMFKGCSSLTSLDVSGFNTAKVENMSEMFRGVQQVKMLDLSNFKTTRVTDMSYMFYGCGNLRAIYVSDQWNTDNVAMDKSVFMFFGCGKLKGYKGTKYHFSVTDKRYARLDEGGLKPGYLSLPSYAVLSPDNKTLTFYQDNNKGTRTGEIFDIEYTADGHVSWYGKCGNVTTVVFDGSFASYVPETCDYWFSGFTKLNSFVNANNFNTSVLSSTKAMFENCTSLTTDGISELLQSASVTTAEVTNMAQMFSGCTSLSTLDMSLLDVSKATNLSGMFSDCTSLERLDMSCMDVANVTNMSGMFSGCSHLQSLYVSDTWDVSGVTQSEGMFSNCTSLVGGQGTRYTASHTDKEYARVDGNPSAGYLTKPEAYACITKYNETTITFYYDGMQSLRGRTCHVYPLKTSGSPYWFTDNSYKIITTVVFDPSFKYAQPTSCECWFYMMDKLKEIQGIEYLNTSEVTTMNGMFYNCKELTSLDLSHFSTESVTDMHNMFFSCESLKSLDLSSFNTANVTSMESMFRGCSELTTINVSEGWSTDKVSYDNSSGMFYNCNKIVGCMGTTYKAGETGKEYARIDKGTSRPGYLSGPMQAYVLESSNHKTLTFYCDARKNSRSADGTVYELNEQWLSSVSKETITKVVFDPSFVNARPTNCNAWFDGFINLTEIDGLGNLNTSCVITMNSMFRNCQKLSSIDVSNFNTENVTDMHGMFLGCGSVKTLDLSSFEVSKVTSMSEMFYQCSNLTTIIVDDEWSTESVAESTDMFRDCKALVGEYGTTYDADHTDATYAHLDRPNAAPGYLSYIYQPYVVITKNQNTFTLTFYYDDLIDTRVGNKYYLNKGNEDNPSWFDQASRINKVVFDPSIANAWISTCSGWFAGMGSLSTIEGLEYLNTSNVMSFRAMFAACESFSDLDLSCLNTEAATDMCEMFCLCSNLTNLNIRNFNTSKVEVMGGMFADCPNLTTITVGDEWSTASVIESTNMFKGCSALVGERGTTYDASHKDASYAHPDGGIDNPGYLTSINKAYAWLQGNSSLGFFFDDKRDTREGTTYDLNTPGNSPGWIDNSVAQKIRSVYFDNSFRRARPVTCEKWFCGLNLWDGIYNIENLNTSEVKDMSYMFKGYNRDLDLSTFNTAKVENMEGMFSEAHIYRLDVSSFNTSQVKNMKDMFSGNDNFTYVNLNSFNTAAVEDMSGMFNGCSRLLSIIVGDEWDTQRVSASTNMFTGCTELVGEKGTLFSDTNPTNKDYAIVDGGSSNPGYLTLNEAKIIYDLAGGELPIGMSNPENFNFGTVITLNNPERAGYEFKGWTGKSRQYGPNKPNLQVTIYSDITYYNRLYIAHWTPIKYTISFDTNGGSSISPINADYESSVAPPQDPVREGYIFDGWLPEIPATMPLGGITVSAQWQPIPYTITFDSNGGSTIPDLTQGYDTDITAPQNPEREGYTFTGWSPELPEKMPLNGMTVTAQWTINNYTITFNTDGGNAIADIVAEYDAAITAPQDPERKGYTFEGWNPTIPAKMPAENLTVKAQWKAIKYKITFDTDGGNTIPDLEQDYESDITAPQDPVKEGYTFTGWEPEIPATMPLDGLTVKAQWTINKYKITFDTDGAGAIDPIEADYQSAITAPKDPEREGYTFKGWEPQIPATMPLDGLTVKAQWTINKYKITFDTDGAGAIDPIEADYQSAITAPKDPVKEGYTFTGWEPQIPATMPLDGLTVKAQWTKNQYTLKFMTDETTVYKQFALDFGAAVAAPADPEKYGFNFGGWQPEVPQTMPANDLTVNAIWLAQGQYVIRFVTQGGTAIDPIVGFAGDAVTPPADPTREGYTFTGWDKPVPTVMPEENTEITAQWKANSYTVTYNAGNGSEPVTVSYDFGAAIATPQQPTREGYTFDGWDAAIPATMPASNLTFSARWKINQYTMTFMTDEATVYKQFTQDFGTAVAAPKNPQRDGYIFGGWDKPVPTTMPAEDITLAAQWAQGEYSITFMTDETTVYKVVAQDFGTAVTAPSDPVRSGYIFLGWDKAVPATMPAENITLTAQWQKAAITVAEQTIEADTRNEYFCNGYAVAAFTVTAGNPTNYTIEFAEGVITTTTGSLTGSSVKIPLPKGLSAGTHTGSLQLADAEGNVSPRIPLALTVSLPLYTIVPLYVDVAAVNKLAGNFTAYQWNENGVALAGETQHYLHRDFSASGVYTATLTLADGSVRETCPLDLTRVNAARRAASVKVYPNPATRDGHVTVEITENYDPSADKTLSIFSISGAQVKQIPNPQEISTLQLPQGTYTGVYEQNGERTTFKVLVK